MIQMKVQSPDTFQVMLQKPLNYSATTIFWSHTMDLIALITESNSLEVFRMGEKAQKIFQIDEKQPITSLDFSPDSQYLVYGRLDGLVQILRTENGEKVFFYENMEDKTTKTKLLGVGGMESVLNEKNKHTRSTIETIKWADYLPKASWESLVPFTKNFKEQQLILAISPHAFCDKNSLIKIRHLTENQTKFTLLLTSEKDNTFVSLNGMILIATLDYSQINLKDFYINYTTYENNIYSVLTHNVEDQTNLYLVNFNCQEFNDQKENIVKVNYLLAYVGELLTFSERSYKTICAKVKEIVKLYQNKICLTEYESQECQEKQSQDMHRLLMLGVPSKPLQEWITKDLHDTPYLTKLDQNLTALFTSLNELALESAQNVLERLVIVLERLIKMSELKVYQNLGLDEKMLIGFHEKIKELYKSGELLLLEALEAKLNVKNMLIWLNKMAIRAMNEVETETVNMRSTLNKYSVDNTRLSKFLKNETQFKLQNLINICLGTNATAQYKPSYQIYQTSRHPSSNNATPAPYSNDPTSFNNLLSQLHISPSFQIPLNPPPSPPSSQSYKSIEIACRQSTHQWLSISKLPIQKLNLIISSKVSTTLLATLESNSNYLLKIHSAPNFMIILFTDSELAQHLNSYDCITGARGKVKCPDNYFIADVAVTSGLMLVLLRSLGEEFPAFVGELRGESFEEGEMVFERRMEVEGESCQLASSEKGLSSMLINGNKIIIVV